MAQVHFMIQGKGGVGKSVICSLLAQKFMADQKKLACYDTDPVNATFTGYKALGAQFVDIMEGGDVNPRKFDNLMEEIINTDAEVVIVDNGASCFIPLTQYIYSNEAVDLLINSGHEVFIHSVVTGGQSLMDTLSGLEQLCETFSGSSAHLIVWKNEFWGKVEADGKRFEEMQVYKDNANKIESIITIEEMRDQTFKQDFSDVLTQKLTFKEALENPHLGIMMKQRLKMTQRDIYNSINTHFN